MWQQPGGLGQDSPEGSICFESMSNIAYCFFHLQDPQVQKSRGGKGKSFTIPSNDPLGKFLLSVSVTLSSAGLKLWFQNREYSCQETQHSIELKTQTFSGLFEILMLLSQQAKKGIRVGGVISLHYQAEIGLFLYNGGKRLFLEQRISFRESLGATISCA